MPSGMYLRSFRSASSIGDQAGKLDLTHYERATGRTVPSPIPLQSFIDYGRWVQESSVPDVDPRRVTSLARNGAGFVVALDDGSTYGARWVVCAAGIAPFARLPDLFADLSGQLVTHSSAHGDFGRFRDKDVLVVGGGQAALESAALLSEAGARAEVVLRRPALRFLRGERLYTDTGSLRTVFYPPHGVGPPGLNRLMGSPGLFRRLPRPISTQLARRVIRPAGAAWLRPRLTDARVTTGRTVEAIWRDGDRARVRLDDGSERTVDHVIVATGYRVDIARYAFLDRGLVESIRRVDGSPRLDASLQSSVPSLFFLGAAAAASAGPGMRFVSHSGLAATAVTKRVLAS
jgi:thioredoxin reductase